MTSIRTFAFISTLLIFAGCAPVRPLVVDDAIGPMQAKPASERPQGFLIVYSDTDRPAADPTDYAPHSDYRLYSMDDQLLRSVTNRNAPHGRAPATVQLPVGYYKVVASAPKFGLISIPVVISHTETTVIDLINEVFSPTNESQPTTGQWVRLPDGQIIGPRAE